MPGSKIKSMMHTIEGVVILTELYYSLFFVYIFISVYRHYI